MTCDRCMREFKSKKDFHQHNDNCSGMEKHKCSDCGKCFYKFENLMEHTKKKHLVRKYILCINNK